MAQELDLAFVDGMVFDGVSDTPSRVDVGVAEGRIAALGNDVAGRIGEHLPALRGHARAIEGTARRHPATAAVIGLAVVGLLAATLFGRR